jgi:8-oxo-dGTP diphosphatase
LGRYGIFEPQGILEIFTRLKNFVDARICRDQKPILHVVCVYPKKRRFSVTVDTFLSVFQQKEAVRFKLKVGLFLLLIQNNQILLLRRYRTGIEDGMYVVPMGGHDGKIPVTDTLIREAEEEAGIRLKPEDVTFCHVMHRLQHMLNELSFEQIDLYFKAESYEGIIENRESDKCDDLQFYPLDALPDTMSPCVLQAIQCTQNKQFFSTFGWEYS